MAIVIESSLIFIDVLVDFRVPGNAHVMSKLKLKDELSMTPEQLEIVFDTLDVEQKGYLTLCQFLEKFNTAPMNFRNNRWKEQQNIVAFKCSYTEDIQTLLQTIKDTNMIKLSIGHLENICKAATQTEPDSAVSVGRVEAFLRALNMDLIKIVEHDRELEEMLQSREVQHQNNMQKLFEELESHFREEQEKTKLEDQRKFRSELTALENELADKEERFRAAVSTRQEFAGQLVAAQQRELAVMAENAKLIETRERLLNDLDAERTKTCQLEEIIERTNAESAADNEKHFKQGFYVAKNLVSLKEEGLLQQLEILQDMKNVLLN
ncbi:EF-hand calcium-binding domain-containing protein 4A-like isoform X2 [Rhopalosiphum maidis]|uniref:EF-hand calcium-binding domain-containing protein 4A-like isoform X2 n=1 Tax=Rhopalosiphum maidis TaxID=43146 RepID=UPI000EFF3455|nr:EF-hand calcium-binding domain-containing protein 4A-like isoform X2 [Rhopalosiphum maidis]